MLQNEFYQELLADILVNAIYNINNNNYDSNNED